MMALVLGVAIPFIVLYLMELLNTTVRGRKELEDTLSIPFLGDIPTYHGKSEHGIAVRATGRDVLSESFRILRTNMSFMSIDNELKVILVTSSTPHSGKTFVSTNLAMTLAHTGKKVLLICNKVDTYDLIYQSNDFYSLGLGDPLCISSMSGSGTGDMMDAILAALPEDTTAEYDADLPRIAIVGRPNVGKSSMTNALLGRERNIVTSVAGTTRDSIHTRYNMFGMDFYLIDTAGMRKKGKVTEDLEFYSVMRSIRAIENSDVCILMLDAEQGIESQDLNIHNLIVRNRKGCVIVVNKWDLIEKGNNTMKEWREFLQKKLAPFDDIPIIFTSVINKQRILDVLQTAVRVYQSRKRRISTSELNDFLLPLIEAYPPAAVKGKYIKIKYVTQLPTPTPQFAFFVNLPQYIKEAYRRFLENKMREQWDFSGVPMQIYFRQK